MKDEEIRRLLVFSGVSQEAFKKTLPMVGCQDVREHLKGGLTQDCPGMYFYPRKRGNGEAASLVLDLACKELVLSGSSLLLVSLVDLYNALFVPTEENEETLSLLNNTDVIGIRDFYQADGRVEPFFSGYQQAQLYSWLRKRLAAGYYLLMHGERPLQEALDWWSASFIKFLDSHSKSFGVS